MPVSCVSILSKRLINQVVFTAIFTYPLVIMAKITSVMVMYTHCFASEQIKLKNLNNKLKSTKLQPCFFNIWSYRV